MSANYPAFPAYYHDFQPESGVQVVREHYYGLTKRELFAAMAMQGLYANPKTADALANAESVTTNSVCDAAVYAADCLLRNLEEGK